MTSMQKALEDLEARKENVDVNIVHQHKVVFNEEQNLEVAKMHLKDLQELSASLSEAISCVKGGLNEKPDSAETVSNG